MVFLHRIEAGTVFPGCQIAMAHDQGFGETFLQLADQSQQRGFLFRGAGVARTARSVQPAFVADADGVAVVILAVRPHLFQRTAPVDLAVAGEVEVVADVAETAVTDVVTAAGLKAKALPLRGGRAMEDDQGDRAHRSTDRSLSRTHPQWPKPPQSQL